MRRDVKQYLDEYIKQFGQLDIEVNALILFGSQAKGTATIASDIDIAVVMEKILTPLDRGKLLSLGDEVDMRFETNLFFTTREAMENATGDFDTNTYIKKEGVVLWPA